MWTDAHAHISNTVYGNADLYQRQMLDAGIGQGVVVPGGMVDVRRFSDYLTERASPASSVPDNRYVAEACKKHPLFIGFVRVNPHEATALEVVEASFREGFRGLKLAPLVHRFSFASQAVAALAACCGDYGFPLYSHVVYSPGASTARFVALVREFPRTNFILGHMGFGPADQEALAAAGQLDNLFLETSTANYLHIKEAAARLGPHKLLFGSEFPLSHPAVEIDKILLLDLTAGEKEKILGENIRALLSLT